MEHLYFGEDEFVLHRGSDGKRLAPRVAKGRRPVAERGVAEQNNIAAVAAKDERADSAQDELLRKG